jgi:hypothetical protein
LVDYSKNIILTKDDYIRMMEAKERRKEQAMAEAAKCKVEAERKKLKRARLKAERDVQKAQHLADAATLKAFKDKWSPTAVAKAGQELHDRIKSRMLPPPGVLGPTCHHFLESSFAFARTTNITAKPECGPRSMSGSCSMTSQTQQHLHGLIVATTDLK